MTRRAETETRNLTGVLVAIGMIRRPDETKLLPAPKTERIRRSELRFDPIYEVRFLTRVSSELRRRVMIQEMAGAIEEKYFVQFSKTYSVVENDLIEVDSEREIMDLVERETCQEEIDAYGEIRRLILNGSKFVVHFSPKNPTLNYEKNCVDFWVVEEEGGEVRWLRFGVKNGLESLAEVYKLIGGQGLIENEFDLLRNPVAPEEVRLAGVLSLLSLSNESTKIESREIRAVTQTLVDGFFKRCGERLYDDPDLVMRVYLAAKNEVKRLINKGKRVDIVAFVKSIAVDFYRWAKMKVRVVKESGYCSGFGYDGEFGATASQGWVIKEIGGRLVVEKGSTEGLTFCERCQCWYSGSRCPLCG